MSTFYLKYRPQIIDELDLGKVRTQLKQALSAKSIPHAFLFSGSRGLGKTSAARIVAKTLNCELPLSKRLDNIEPCNQCQSCLTITKGSSIDVIEIDGASNRGIDDIRALRETVNLAPIQLKNKVYIIDEVHMLTKEAFNALLKTLEEPPSHVYFILATTEPHKIPETIISRSFHIQFNRANKVEIIRSLQRVVQGEGLEVEDKIYDVIITKTRGGFRDSVKLLEQLAFASKKITLDQFIKLFGQNDIETLIQFLVDKNGAKALDWVFHQEELGVDWTDIFRNILNFLRDKLINIIKNNTMDDIELNKDNLIKMINLFIQASVMQKTTLVETLPIELVIAQWVGDLEPNINPKEISNKKNPEPKTVLLNQTEAKSSLETDTKVIQHSIQKQEKSETDKSNGKQIEKMTKVQTLPITINDLKDKWDTLLTAIRSQNRSMESMLRNSALSKVDGDILSITVYYGLHKQQLESDKYLRIFESTFQNIFGLKPRLLYILGDRQEKMEVDAIKDKELEKNVKEIFQ